MKTSVIVANHGRDLTILKSSLPKGVEFIEVNLGLERSRQRNMGIDQSIGNVILWLDSDMSIQPELIKECENLISIGFSCVYIPEVIVSSYRKELSLFGKIRRFEREFYTGTAVDVPRAVARRYCPRFSEELHGPEDAHFGNQIKGMRATSKHCLYHHDDISISEYIKKKIYYTKSMRRYEQLNPNDKCLDLKYRCFDVFVEKGKWKNLICHPILTVGIILLLAVRGIIYARR